MKYKMYIEKRSEFWFYLNTLGADMDETSIKKLSVIYIGCIDLVVYIKIYISKCLRD
jgi:hypothetical protein